LPAQLLAHNFNQHVVTLYIVWDKVAVGYGATVSVGQVRQLLYKHPKLHIWLILGAQLALPVPYSDHNFLTSPLYLSKYS
jgi:hypothetical protein